MVKWIGVVLVLVAGTMIGFLQAARFAERPRQIKNLAHALQRLETEIGYGYTPLPDALRRTAEHVSPAIAAILNDAADRLHSSEGPTFQECWAGAVTSCWPQTSMKSGEQAVLLRLGSTLGISDREDQIKHLRLAMLQLKAEEASAADDQSRYEKMSKSLGILVAALVVILMV